MSDTAKKDKHNGIISFWKFAFCIMVIAFHLGLGFNNETIKFSGGSIAVDFFFLTSGYFFIKGALKTKVKKDENIGKATFKYIIKKFLRFLPYFVLMVLIGIPYYTHISKLKPIDFIDSFWSAIYFPIKNNTTGPFFLVWYISAMILVEVFYYPLILKYKEDFIYRFCPIIVIILGGYLGIKYGTLTNPEFIDGIVYKGTIRAFFDMALSGYIYILAEKMKKTNFTVCSKIIFTILEILGFISIFILVNTKNADSLDFTFLFILFFSISFALSNKTYDLKFANNKIFYFLEKVSLPMYLDDMMVIDGINYYKTQNNILLSYEKELIIAIILSFLIGIIILYIVEIIKYLAKKSKKIFIKEEKV